MQSSDFLAHAPEVRLGEVKFSRTSLPLSSPRTPFLVSFRVRDSPGLSLPPDRVDQWLSGG
jgi:hypothetical protein